MEAALKFVTTVLPGHRIEVMTPELPEGANVALFIYRQPEMENARSETDCPSTLSASYPITLNAEYTTLIETQWQRALTVSEQARLEAIKGEIDARDAASDDSRLRERQIENIHQQLAAIRQVVEALPDAS
jgi:hypothetical protein